MGEQTGISWTDHTWNPWHGCLKISPGCKNCYMYREKEQYGQDPFTVVRAKTVFNAPLKWKSGRVFTCSWSDFFIEQADAWRDEAWDIIRRTPHLTYQILTKRPERILAHLPSDWGSGWKHIWLGVSVENQQYADERIPPLLQTPASVRFISVEPMLEAIDLGLICKLTGDSYALHWVICGGESGPGARPFDINWAWNLLDQCRIAGVPFFMKQLGSNSFCQGCIDQVPHFCGSVKTKDRKGGDPAEWPAYLRIQEFPR